MVLIITERKRYDLPNSSDYFTFRLFADDSNLFHTFPVRKYEIDLREITIELKKVLDWCNVNKLTINLSKTNYMLIRGQRQAINVQGRIQIMDTDLHEVDVTTFIGVDIDQHLTWKSHIAKVKLCIRKKVGILYRLRNFVPQNILILLYKTFMQPHYYIWYRSLGWS